MKLRKENTPVITSPAQIMKTYSTYYLNLVLVMTSLTLAQLSLPAQAVFTTESKFTAGDPATDDRFGTSTALSGNAVVVGAPFDDDLGFDAGSAYVFRRASGGWLEQKLLAPDGQAFDNFGAAVAVEGDLVVVGSPGSDSETANDSGAAYLFRWNGDQWIQEAKLTPSDPVPGARFGQSVALEGNTLAIGAYGALDENGTNSGAVYVFVRNGTEWTQQARLTAHDGWRAASFGFAISLSGDTLVSSAFGSHPSGEQGVPGAYIFVRDDTNWTLQTKLTGPRGQAFGFSVAVSGDSVAIGDYFDSERANLSGAVFVYQRSGTTWTFQQKLFPSDPRPQSFFGRAVAVQGNSLIAGALNLSAAYVFRNSESGWTETQRLATIVTSGDQFGTSVALAGNAALVGAPGADTIDTGNSGAAYLYERGGP